MRGQIQSCLFNRWTIVVIAGLASACSSAPNTPGEIVSKLPIWITEPKLEDAAYQYVVCSSDGLDPEETRLIAEGKCLTSAAKLGGVNVTVRQKTVQSLTGTDSGEVSEIEPLNQFVRCDFVERYMEPLATGVRVWLMCRASKAGVAKAFRPPRTRMISQEPPTQKIDTYKKSMLYVTSVPQADKIVISGDRGERVIDVSRNPQMVEIREGDNAITVRRQGYRDSVAQLGDWSSGQNVSKTVYLDREM